MVADHPIRQLARGSVFINLAVALLIEDLAGHEPLAGIVHMQLGALHLCNAAVTVMAALFFCSIYSTWTDVPCCIVHTIADRNRVREPTMWLPA